MKTTNTDPRKGTAVITASFDKKCDFCGRKIPAGTKHVEDFVTCCEACDDYYGDIEEEILG